MSKMKFVKIILTAILMLAAIVLSAGFLYYALSLTWPMPHSDQWIDLEVIGPCILWNDQCNLMDLLAIHNQHRLFITRILHLIEYHFFSGKNIFLSTCAVAFHILFVIVVIRSYWNQLKNNLDKIGALSISLIFILNPVNAFNCLHSFNIQWILCFFFGFLVISAFVKFKGNFSFPFFISLTILLLTTAGAFAIFPALMLLSYFFFDNRRNTAILFLMLVAATLIYYFQPVSSFINQNAPAGTQKISLPLLAWYFFWEVPRFVLSMLGSLFTRVDFALGFLIGNILIIMFLIAIIRYRRNKSQVSSATVLFFGFALFAFFMMLETGIGRATTDGQDYRYQIQAMMFWMSVTTIFYLARISDDNIPGRTWVLAGCFLPWLFSGISLLRLESIGTDYLILKNRIVSTQHAYFSGLTDKSVVHETYGHMPTILRIASNKVMIQNLAFLKRHKLGGFSSPQIFELHKIIDIAPATPVCEIQQMTSTVIPDTGVNSVATIYGLINFAFEVSPTFYIVDDKNYLLAYGVLERTTLLLPPTGQNRILTPIPYNEQSAAGVRVLFLDKSGEPYCLSTSVLPTK